MLSEKYAKNPEYYKAKGKKWRQDNPDEYARHRLEAAERHRNKAAADPEFREKYNAYCRERYHKQKLLKRERNLLVAARSRAKKVGREFTIDESDIHIPDVCPVLGIPLVTNDGYGKDDSPSIDRIDNTKGYVKGNVQVISRKANAMKNDATLEELRLFAKWINECMS